jgi:hypothetical protein
MTVGQPPAGAEALGMYFRQSMITPSRIVIVKSVRVTVNRSSVIFGNK